MWASASGVPGRVAEGCRCNRVPELVEEAGFAIEDRSDAAWQVLARIVGPIVSGIARPGAPVLAGSPPSRA